MGGGKEDLLSGYKGARNREAGVPSFAYRNALSDRLSMHNDPAGYFCFYYLPSPFYQKLVLNLKEIKEERVQSELFELIKKGVRLRAKVDFQLNWTDAVVIDRRPSWLKQSPLLSLLPEKILFDRFIMGPARSWEKLNSLSWPTVLPKVSSRPLQAISLIWMNSSPSISKPLSTCSCFLQKS